MFLQDTLPVGFQCLQDSCVPPQLCSIDHANLLSLGYTPSQLWLRLEQARNYPTVFQWLAFPDRLPYALTQTPKPLKELNV